MPNSRLRLLLCCRRWHSANASQRAQTNDYGRWLGRLGAEICNTIALGPHAGCIAFTLQTLPSTGQFEHAAAQANGFSLYVGVVATADQRAKPERLCRHRTRPAVSRERLSLTAQGVIHYRQNAPYRDCTTHLVFEPLDFMTPLAVLVPKLRVNLTRYHGVIAPNHPWRKPVTPARRGRRPAARLDELPAIRHAAMHWAQRLKRAFKIDIETCETGGRRMNVISSIDALALTALQVSNFSDTRNILGVNNVDDPQGLTTIANSFDADAVVNWVRWQPFALRGHHGYTFTASVGSFAAQRVRAL